ncbi:Ni/Fe hydrogenase [Caloramator sp. E03]|uniref:nickel-dependent hydrogenase large subunit n=1 Tax=Caloramator sp. E03 TaxID=2576307 RepID=UPI00111049CC|nr:nickel-dependent hydrogenase large subunit [Caloramator sp. E03]QCX34174.1 Ni/Fe hydrogenase [Caloramator sp. E03]
MSNIIYINPITRISGFLEIEVKIENSEIVDAKSSGVLYRGFEKMLLGRSPLDAIYFTERICGICSTAHSMASTLCLEDALKITPNLNSNLLRNIIHGCEFIQNHIRHFYQFVIPDYVKGPDIIGSSYSNNDYRLPENLSYRINKNYIESLTFSRAAHEMISVLGGKAPHNHGIFVGGVTCNIDSAKIIKLQSLLKSIKDFVNTKMLEDVYIISQYYSDYFNIGIGCKNLLTYGLFDFDDKSIFYVKPSVLINGMKYPFEKSNITENVFYSWYETQSESVPFESPPDTNLNKKDAYSFVKAPRYKGYPMETGPLSRMYLSGIYKRGVSTMDRIVARALEAEKIIDIVENMLNMIEILPSDQDIYEIPDSAIGAGLTDTTRGSLAHYISIKDKKIEKYDIITPSTWNLSSRSENGTKGPVESALIGTFISDLSSPVEIGRIVRSFDPCISCATHVAVKDKNPIDFIIDIL